MQETADECRFKGEVEFYGAFLFFFFFDFLTLFHLSITVPTKPRRSAIAQWPSARLRGATNASLILVFILMIDVFALSSIFSCFAPSSRIVSHKFNGN